MNPAIFLPITNLPLHSFAPMHAAEDHLSFPLFSLWTQLFFCLITKYGNSPDIPLPTSIFTNTISNHPFPFFNLLQSGFYFLYKFPSSLKALLPSFGEVFLVWSFCLFLQLSVHQNFENCYLLVVMTHLSSELSSFSPYPYLRSERGSQVNRKGQIQPHLENGT